MWRYPSYEPGAELTLCERHCGAQITTYCRKMAGLEQSRTRTHIRYQASDSATILAMVREGLGITLIPRMMVSKKLEGVVALPLDPTPQLPLGLAVRSQKMASRGAKLFIQTAMSLTQRQAALKDA